jgi:hypothetical protein
LTLRAFETLEIAHRQIMVAPPFWKAPMRHHV